MEELFLNTKDLVAAVLAEGRDILLSQARYAAGSEQLVVVNIQPNTRIVVAVVSDEGGQRPVERRFLAYSSDSTELVENLPDVNENERVLFQVVICDGEKAVTAVDPAQIHEGGRQFIPFVFYMTPEQGAQEADTVDLVFTNEGTLVLLD